MLHYYNDVAEGSPSSPSAHPVLSQTFLICLICHGHWISLGRKCLRRALRAMPLFAGDWSPLIRWLVAGQQAPDHLGHKEVETQCCVHLCADLLSTCNGQTPRTQPSTRKILQTYCLFSLVQRHHKIGIPFDLQHAAHDLEVDTIAIVEIWQSTTDVLPI